MMFSGIVDAIEYDLKAGNYTASARAVALHITPYPGWGVP